VGAGRQRDWVPHNNMRSSWAHNVVCAEGFVQKQNAPYPLDSLFLWNNSGSHTLGGICSVRRTYTGQNSPPNGKVAVRRTPPTFAW
jgi:hypothetical protein